VKRLLVTFDVEEVDWGSPAARSGWEPCRPSAEGLAAILPMLERLGLPTTLFCTSSFARAHQDPLRDAAARGHEIASHGLDHRDDYATMAPAVAAGRLRDSRLELEDATGSVVRGLRTPRLAPCSATAIAEAGFSYDASPHPTWVRHGLRGLRMPRVPWSEAGIVRVPLSATPGLRLPAGWYVLRALGAAPAALLARRAGAGAPWVHLYFHPWEAVDLRRWMGAHPLGWGTGTAWVASLERLLERLAARLSPATVGAAVDAWRASRISAA
jgi:peptidoglycan/xylan/chitin deacetylase (PgdA/CDA1 family)